MAKKISLGKEALSELGLKFIVANVPLFPIGIDKIYIMKILEFHTKEELVEKLSSIKNLVVFDEPSVYGEKINKDIHGEQDIFMVRCVTDLTDKHLSVIKNNIQETVTQIFSFQWDFSCFE